MQPPTANPQQQQQPATVQAIDSSVALASYLQEAAKMMTVVLAPGNINGVPKTAQAHGMLSKVYQYIRLSQNIAQTLQQKKAAQQAQAEVQPTIRPHPGPDPPSRLLEHLRQQQAQQQAEMMARQQAQTQASVASQVQPSSGGLNLPNAPPQQQLQAPNAAPQSQTQGQTVSFTAIPMSAPSPPTLALQQAELHLKDLTAKLSNSAATAGKIKNCIQQAQAAIRETENRTVGGPRFDAKLEGEKLTIGFNKAEGQGQDWNVALEEITKVDAELSTLGPDGKRAARIVMRVRGRFD
jgi:hypothetical protein